MLPITYYLIANPLIAIGLAILVVLCIANVLRRRVRTALGLWLVILATLVYVYMQAAIEQRERPDTVDIEDLPDV